MLTRSELIEKYTDMICQSDIGLNEFMFAIGNKYKFEGFIDIDYWVSNKRINAKVTESFKKKISSNLEDSFAQQVKLLFNLLPVKGISDYDTTSTTDISGGDHVEILDAIYNSQYEHHLRRYPTLTLFEAIIDQLILLFSIYVKHENKKYEVAKIQKLGIELIVAILRRNFNSIPTVLKPKGSEEMYVYNPEKVQIEPIKEISEFVKIILNIRQDGTTTGKEHYYRGQPSARYCLLPAVFRKISLRKNEDKLYKELQRICPNNFSENNSAVEYLVDMQHYELPTRLIDITQNALVALYFACSDCVALNSSEEGQDGEVIIFNIESEEFESNYFELRLALPLLIDQEKYKLYVISKYLYDYEKIYAAYFALNRGTWDKPMDTSTFYAHIGLAELKPIDTTEEHEAEKKRSVKEHFIEHLTKFIESLQAEVDPNQIYLASESLNKLLSAPDKLEDSDEYCLFGASQVLPSPHDVYYSFPLIQDFLQAVKIVFPSFQGIIEPDRVLGAKFIKAALKNPRIIKQSGAFILAGLYGMGVENIIADLGKFRYLNSDNKNQIIIIPAKSKSTILSQLKAFDINEATIYPEIDHVAKYLSREYRSQESFG